MGYTLLEEESRRQLTSPSVISGSDPRDAIKDRMNPYKLLFQETKAPPSGWHRKGFHRLLSQPPSC